MTTISNKVRYYNHAQFGAPVLSGVAGALVGVLDACLVNGYGTKTLNTLTVADGIATATISAGHTFEPGAVVRVSGATPGALNSDWRIAAVDGNDIVWSVEGLGVADGSATGTITAMYAPAGWQKVYSGTNLAAYRSANHADHNGMFLRVADTTTKCARVRGYEAMSDVSTGTGTFPTNAQLNGGVYWGKSDSTGPAARKWALVADDRRLAFFPCPHSTLPVAAAAYTFGQLRDAADLWAHVVSGASSAANAEWGWIGAEYGVHIGSDSQSNYIYMPRSDSGAGSAVVGHVRTPAAGYMTGSSAYSAASVSDAIWGVEGVVFSGLEAAGGRYRGVACGPMHLANGLASAAGGFDMIGSVGNGILLLHLGGNTETYVMGASLGNDGRWD